MHIQRLESEVMILVEFKDNSNFDKILKIIQENYELLKRYIDETNLYARDLHERILSKLNLKADTDFFDTY